MTPQGLGAGPAFALAAAGFASAAALSYAHQRLGFLAVLGWSALVIAARPMAGWALVIFAVPFQSLFALGSGDFGRIRSALFLMLGARMAALVVQRRTYRATMLWCLLAFTALVFVHDAGDGSSLKSLAWDTMYFLALGAVYIVSRRFGARADGMAVGQAGIAAAALGSAVLSFAFLYFPLPGLIADHPRLDNLRLFGIQDNPNSLAKLLLPALLLFATAVIFRPSSRRWILLTLATVFLLAATGTKSVFIASVVTAIVLLPALNRHGPAARRVWVLPTVVVLGYAAWLGVAPWIERHAAQRWVAAGEGNLCFYLQTNPGDPVSCRAPVAGAHKPQAAGAIAARILSVAGRDLRVEDSQAMVVVNGKTVYERRAFSPMQVGQRDRTWRAGLTAVERHWAWGIGGPDQWARYMRQVIGYPFSSPHDGLLEVAGGYGVLGAFLYILVMGLFVRNYLRLRGSVQARWQRMANEWVFLCGAGVFVVELADVLTVFGSTIHAVWFWAILGLQAGLGDAAAAPMVEADRAA